MPWIGTTFTNQGADVTGLTPKINIYDMADNSLVVNQGTVLEIAEGGYKYNFTGFDPTKNYFWKIDGGAALPTYRRYRRGWTGYAGAIPDAQAGTNGGLGTVNGSNYVAGMQGTKNTLDDMNDVSTAEVNSEVVDALNVDTYAEPGQGTPPATATLVQKIGYLFKFWRNKNTRDANSVNIYNDVGNEIDQKATTSDDGATFTKGEYESGP